jgi:Cu2+-exporting ATPase
MYYYHFSKLNSEIFMTIENDKPIYIPLEGVESEHCALIIDKELSRVPGITMHKVELNNKRAVIITTDPLQSLPKVVKAIRDVGYEVPTSKKNFQY